MTITVPTAVSIKTRFPEFADVDDTVIEFAIEDATFDMPDEWNSGHNVALAYLVAHYVSCRKAAAASGGAGGSGVIASESIGRLSVSYAQSSSTPEAVPDDKESTSYGRRYLEILGANFAGPRIV